MLIDRWEVGGVGTVETATGALESDGAGVSAGFDVGGFDAVSIRDGHRPHFVDVGRRCGRRRSAAIDDERTPFPIPTKITLHGAISLTRSPTHISL